MPKQTKTTEVVRVMLVRPKTDTHPEHRKQVVRGPQEEYYLRRGYQHADADDAAAHAAATAAAESAATASDGVPSVEDKKAVWVAYAVAQGADQDKAEAATKKQLIEAFGG